jgi:hypothetical protein
VKTLRLTSRTPHAFLAVALTLSMQASGFADIKSIGGSAAAQAHTHVNRLQLQEPDALNPAAPIKVKSGLEAFDDSLLGNRTPLILVHGIASYQYDNFNWENFLSFTARKPEFQAKYKIYLYHYDSRRSVPDISRDLQATLKGFIGALHDRNIKILAYSEGGLLTRNALQDPYLDSHTTEVLAIATPFHGSPLANPRWIQQQVKTENMFNPVRIGQKIAYKITGHKFPTFRQDFHWDNFDGAIPMADYVKDNGPMVQTSYALAKKTNFVTYGSYFGLEVDPAFMQDQMGLRAPLPKEKPQLRNLFRRNFLFSLVRNNIGRLPLASVHNSKAPQNAAATSTTASASQTGPSKATITLTARLKTAVPQAPVATLNQSLALGKELVKPELLTINVSPSSLPTGTDTRIGTISAANIHKATPSPVLAPVSMMMFNDGISPISSTLWLGRFTPNSNGSAIPVEKLWSTLKSLQGSGQARLFPGLDHRNWMDGTTRTGQDQIQDLLNPNEPPRTVFEWIVYDLMS